jgi:hypothetical protein
MLRPILALAILAVVAACGGKDETQLTIQISNAYGEQTYELTCDPPGGNVADPRTLCEQLGADSDVILFARPDNRTCLGGPSTPHIHVAGRFQGRAVDTSETDLCEGNLKAHWVWSSLQKR